MAAWTGISGDLNEPEKWPAAEMVTNAWLERNIRLGPLGTLYPPHVYIMEGDTPSLLYLIPNGLNIPEHPEWGGWGGRYVKSDLSAGHYGDAADAFTAGDGKIFTSNQATIFRWRDAFQRDFAARMRWTVADSPSNANHSPVAVLNGVAGRSPVKIVARAGESVRLSARGSSDPDGQPLSYRWLYYREPAGGFFPPSVTLDGSGDQEASFVVPKVDGPIELHVILEVTDTGTPSMTTYRRALVSVAGGAR